MALSKTYKVGVTGGIGSGKSTVCRIFELLKVPFYNSDIRAKELIHQHPTLIQLYKECFGNDIYIDGSLDTKRVSEQLFEQPQLLHKIQTVVHPIVRADFSDWVNQQTSKIVVNEAAVLFEGGNYKNMDSIITVVAPKKLRVKRVMKRSALTQQEVEARMNNQWSDEQKVALSNYVVYADNLQLVVPQVLTIYNNLMKIVEPT